MKRTILCLVAMMGMLTLSAQAIYEFKVKNDAGKPDIKWNFTKFLVSADGQVLKRYEPTDKISQIEEDVKQALKGTHSN